MIKRLLPHIRQFVFVRDAVAGADALGLSLTQLLETNSIGVIQLDRRGRIAEANDRARDLCGGAPGCPTAAVCCAPGYRPTMTIFRQCWPGRSLLSAAKASAVRRPSGALPRCRGWSCMSIR